MLSRLRASPVFADPRHGQMFSQGVLIACGVVWFSFEMQWWRPLAAVAAAVATQFLFSRILRQKFDWRSPVISALALTLLLRTDGPALAALAGVIAVASKALIRFDGRHFFNPGAFAIVVTVLLFDGAWVSPGQWGTTAWIAVVAMGLGMFVTGHAKRWEVPLIFLAAWAALSFGRALYMGDPMAIPLHQMQNGALVIFAFFMISDPMTAPWHPVARAIWLVIAAVVAFALQFEWVVAAGPIFGLVCVAPLVPLFNRLFKAPRAQWRRPGPGAGPNPAPAPIPATISSTPEGVSA